MIIKNNITATIEVKKSKFITLLIKVDDVCEVKSILDDIKKQYKGANHYCYAYIINKREKASDDGEPSKTAGIPILNILKVEDLENILCIVIRYFGGIKLGAGGLIRAYSSATKEAIKIAEKIELINYINYKVSFKYNEEKIMDYILKEYIVSKTYTEVITYELEIPTNFYTEILNKIKKVN